MHLFIVNALFVYQNVFVCAKKKKRRKNEPTHEKNDKKEIDDVVQNKAKFL